MFVYGLNFLISAVVSLLARESLQKIRIERLGSRMPIVHNWLGGRFRRWVVQPAAPPVC